jgi:hypothetical protein
MGEYERLWSIANKRVVELETALAAAQAHACHHGWRGSKPEDGEQIANRCPACGGQVFIGKGGYLTCSVLSCPAPDAPSDALAENATLRRDAERLDGLSDLDPSHVIKLTHSENAWYWSSEPRMGCSATVRQAIDAALSKARGQRND